MLKQLLFFLMVMAIAGTYAQTGETPKVIHGIYGSPTPFWEGGYRLDSLGVNAIFVRGSSINGDMMDRAREEGVKVFVEFPSLNGKDYVEKHPEAWAINEQGEQVEAAGWFMGVCPTEPGFRQYREAQLRELLRRYKVDGIWMDYVHWHAQFEGPKPILPETCFCAHCQDAFESAMDIELPVGSIQEKAIGPLHIHRAILNREREHFY